MRRHFKQTGGTRIGDPPHLHAFHLRMQVFLADVPIEAVPDRGRFVSKHQFKPTALPTVMKKAISVATPWPARD